MPVDHTRQHQATAAVGLGLIAAGAQRRARGLKHIDALLSAKRARFPEPARVALTRHEPGLRYARQDVGVGTLVGTAGAAPATAGILGLHKDREQKRRLFAKRDTFDPYDFAATGVKGAVDANRKAYGRKPAAGPQHHSALAGAATAGLVLGASALGGQASRRAAPHFIHERFHPATHAVVGTVAGASAIPEAHKIVSHIVRRKKKPAVRPSTQSVRVEGRDNHPVRKALDAGSVKVHARNAHGDPACGAGRAYHSSVISTAKAGSPKITCNHAACQALKLSVRKGMDASEVHVNGPLMIATGRKRKLKIPPAVQVQKADVPAPNPAQARRQLRRKKRQFGLSALATGGGIAALGGTIAASKHANLPVNIAHRAGKIAVHGGAVAGAAGSGAAVEGLQIQRRDLKQQAQLLPPKA